MAKFSYDVDLEAVRDDAAKLPAQLDSLDKLADGLAILYRENADTGKFILDTTLRDRVVDDLCGAIEKNNLKSENAQLRSERDRQRIAQTVRAALVKAGVKPNMLDAAYYTFMAKHKCAIDEQGRVAIVGKVGATNADLAAVRFLDEQEAEAAFAEIDNSKSGEATSALHRLFMN
ncbi:MAG: hypothetical protein Q8M31_19355 [Beijerinckiaceae bacterium]|nr:hypothetical protein [Beijerinckiaceae bacterium]